MKRNSQLHTALTHIPRYALIFEKLLHSTFIVSKFVHIQEHALQSGYACPVVEISPGHGVHASFSCMLP